MSSSLLQTAKELPTPDVVARASSLLGEPQDLLSKALTGVAVPLLLSGLAGKVERGDDTGDSASNLKLSRDRAASVERSLVGLGLAEGRLEAEGYGEQHPVASNATDEGRAKNRRIAMRVTSH